MTITNTNSVVSALSDGVTTAFAYSFLVPYQSDGVTPAIDVQVETIASGLRTDLIWGSGFTVTGIGNVGGGTVVITPALAVGSRIWIGRALAYNQPNAFTNQAFVPHSIETALDRVLEQVQQLARDMATCLRMPLGVSVDSTPGGTKGKAFVLDAAGALAYMAIVAGTVVPDASSIAYTPAGAGAVVTTVQNRIRQLWVSVKDLGAVGDGVTDDTAAINAAIAYAKTFPNGMTVYFPRGAYAVTEINMLDTVSQFSRTIRLLGDGRWATRIIPKTAGNCLINCLGLCDGQFEGFTIDSTALVSQCGIYMARTAGSPNANNNNFRDVYTQGSFSKAPIVAIGSESSRWWNCRFENTSAAANYTLFMGGGTAGAVAVAGIVTVNGNGTGIDGPDTDNRMFGCELYAPFTGAQHTRWISSAGYNFFGTTFIGGTANNVQFCRLTNQIGLRWTGPLQFHGCHFEVFGTNNSIVYLADTGASITYNGIGFSGCFLQTATNGIAITDFDRTILLTQPILEACNWRGWSGTANGSGTVAYAYAVFSCDINLRVNNADGTLVLFAYQIQSDLKATTLVQGSQRIVGGVSIQGFDVVGPPLTGAFAKGMHILVDQPAVGAAYEYVCTVSGARGTLNGGATTITGNIGQNFGTVNSVTGLYIGAPVNIATAGGPYLVRAIAGTTVYFDLNLVANVVAQAVSYQAAVLTALPNL